MSRQVTQAERERAIALWDGYYEKLYIARALGRSMDCVSKILRRAERIGKPRARIDKPPQIEAAARPPTAWPDGWAIKPPTMAQLRAGK